MGYIPVKFQKELKIIDNNNELPSKWNDFVNNVAKYHNLIIKTSKNSFCTHCRHEFISNHKVGEKDKCPYCKKTYLVKSSRLSKYQYNDYIILVDNVLDDIVFRYFEIRSVYNRKAKKFESDVVEFARRFRNNNITIVNERVSKGTFSFYVIHSDQNSNYFNPKIWRSRKMSYYYDILQNGYVYPYNLKKVFKNDTYFKYVNLSAFVKYYEVLDIKYYIENYYNNVMFERLLKMKLFKLAREAKEFGYCENNSFYGMLGVSKDYYDFIKKHQLSYNELKILQILKEKDIRKIKLLSKYSITAIEDISNLIGINKLIAYIRILNKKIDLYMYKDYLVFAKKLGLDLKNKKIIYPKNLRQKHDLLENEIMQHNREIVNHAINKRITKLNKNIFSKGNYKIIPAASIEDLENESNQQSNCVRTYADNYSMGICDIYFMRNKNKMNKSLVTVEVRNNKVVQSKIKHNEKPTEKQLLFLKLWQEQVLAKCIV